LKRPIRNEKAPLDEVRSELNDQRLKFNAGWEPRNGRTICRWMIVWVELFDSEFAGCAAGYSGGGSFQLEKFYLRLSGAGVTFLQIDNEEKISGNFADFSCAVPPGALRTCENCQDEILSWHDREKWDQADNLCLLPGKFQDEISSDDMLIQKNSDAGPFIRVLEFLGITSRPSK
jgi:hypothetical protein